MIWRDIINDSDLWTGLRLEVKQGVSGEYQLESGTNCRFKLHSKKSPILWGTFGSEYWGVWILNNKVDWELNDMPVKPINSSTIEESKNADFYPFWSRFFAKQLSNGSQSILSSLLWTITIGASFENRMDNTLEFINDIDNAFDKENPRWVEWDIGRCGSIVALKNEPNEENGRVKWFRKLVHQESCPPVLVWYLSCIDGYVILDGHSRLKAFQLESVPAKFLVLNSVIEEEIKRDPKVQENILLGLEKRQKNQVKRKMNVEEVNKLLISAFDTRPYCRPITSAKARNGYEEKWTSEVREQGVKLNLNSDIIEDMIKRIEN
ncbi:hypothetical protein SAMN05661096_03317 [Marivirga sericea]|uniref:Uncharacterized protein n=1 Tax=Marivirga sericea TaxID=1028 RepID=A0A1X7KZI7_9BACT|nr:hypothetical protein [Marivirga sericea]SMG46865.1 hypothetical protein SAMN05661096_03317 [Marivirga sericea]